MAGGVAMREGGKFVEFAADVHEHYFALSCSAGLVQPFPWTSLALGSPLLLEEKEKKTKIKQ